MRKLFCLSLLFVCSPSCSAIVDGKLEDKRTTDAPSIKVTTSTPTVMLHDPIQLTIMVQNFKLVDPEQGYAGDGHYVVSSPTLAPDKTHSGFKETFLITPWDLLKPDGAQDAPIVQPEDLIRPHTLRVELVNHDGSSLEPEAADKVEIEICGANGCNGTVCEPPDLLDCPCAKDKCTVTEVVPCVQIVSIDPPMLTPGQMFKIEVVSRGLGQNQQFDLILEVSGEELSLGSKSIGESPLTFEIPDMIDSQRPIPIGDALLRVVMSVGTHEVDHCWPVVIEASDIAPKNPGS